MTNCIKAHVRMEERYEGLQLVYGDNPQLKQDVLDAIEYAKKETGMEPNLFGNEDQSNPEKEAIYLEFNDDSQRDSGNFFEIILHKLNIKCEDDNI